MAIRGHGCTVMGMKRVGNTWSDSCAVTADDVVSHARRLLPHSPLGWGWHMHRRLEATLDDLRKRGEPMTIAEFRIEPLPDAQNALGGVSAGRGRHRDEHRFSRNSILEYNDDFPRGPDWVKLAQGSEQANAQVFAQAPEGRSFGKGQQWKEFPSTRRQLGAVVSTTSSRNWSTCSPTGRNGATSRAMMLRRLKRLIDVLHVADRVRQDPLLVPPACRYRHRCLGAYAALWIAPVLVIRRGRRRDPPMRNRCAN